MILNLQIVPKDKMVKYNMDRKNTRFYHKDNGYLDWIVNKVTSKENNSRKVGKLL